MSFSNDNGYSPPSIEAILTAIMIEINAQFGTSYTYESFIGTNFYKYMYALAQRVQENEIKTSEIFLYLEQYFEITNESIQRPVGTNPGVIEALERNGFIASVKPTIDADAGKVYICVNVDDTLPGYAAVKLAVNTIIKNSISAGVVSQGAQTNNIVLSNGQSFTFKFDLPDRHVVKLKLTLTLSENNQVVIDTPENVKSKLLANINARYRLGKNFEPQKYFTTADAPWTSQVLLEWSTDGGTTWHSTIYDSLYDDLFDVKLENITLVEA